PLRNFTVGAVPFVPFERPNTPAFGSGTGVGSSVFTGSSAAWLQAFEVINIPGNIMDNSHIFIILLL
ncbi:MAG: hypothetical protein K2J62_03965, partial [Bacteroidales bacterium]|nr:hypothetical protein [Bacteroidales bacterium]